MNNYKERNSCRPKKPYTLEKMDLLEYFHATENNFHSMELDKTMEIGFSNLFLQYFQNIPIRWKRLNFSSDSFPRTRHVGWHFAYPVVLTIKQEYIYIYIYIYIHIYTHTQGAISTGNMEFDLK